MAALLGLSIVALTLIAIYAAERVIFRQRPMRAAGMAGLSLLLNGSDALGMIFASIMLGVMIAILALTTPIWILYWAYRKLSGYTARMCAPPEFGSSTARLSRTRLT